MSNQHPFAPLLDGLRQAAACWNDPNSSGVIDSLVALGLIGNEADLDLADRLLIVQQTAQLDGGAALWLLCRWLATDLLAAAGADLAGEGATLPVALAVWESPGSTLAETVFSGVSKEGTVLAMREIAGTIEVHHFRVSDGAAGGPITQASLGLQSCHSARLSVPEGSCALVTLPLATVLDIWQRGELYAGALRAGLLRASYGVALAWAGDRQQGGCRIIEHGIVQRMLAQMLHTAEELEALLHSTGGIEPGKPLPVGVLATANRLAAQTVEACSRGVQVLGGNGYMDEYGQSRRLCDAQQAEMLLGHPWIRYETHYGEKIV